MNRKLLTTVSFCKVYGPEISEQINFFDAINTFYLLSTVPDVNISVLQKLVNLVSGNPYSCIFLHSYGCVVDNQCKNETLDIHIA